MNAQEPEPIRIDDFRWIEDAQYDEATVALTSSTGPITLTMEWSTLEAIADAAIAQIRLDHEAHLVLGEVLAKRSAQDEKWGQQDLSVVTWQGRRSMAYAEAVSEMLWDQDFCDEAASEGVASWFLIARKELQEALEAATRGDRDATRAELIQLAAVAVAAVEAIDRGVDIAREVTRP